jgi:gluconate 2-dehydrogenase subunit 3-like protein
MTGISRRVTLAWIAAASASAFAPGSSRAAEGGAPASWSNAALPPVTAPGYGHDPDLNAAAVPWPLTFNPHQRAILRLAADLMLPADAHSPSGGALPLDAFLDEWISAPYPLQQQDRALILPGLAWLDAEAGRRFSVDFASASDAQRRAIFDAIAFRDRVAPGYEQPAQFFARLRGLMLVGFYTLPEGMADIGYLGNKPLPGDYPGPTPDAMAHLNANLVKLGLKPFNPG